MEIMSVEELAKQLELFEVDSEQEALRDTVKTEETVSRTSEVPQPRRQCRIIQTATTKKVE